MADIDEDVIPRSGPPAEDADLTDETQDFRFLASISREDATIPKRGEKDFEPHATSLQSNTLAASRQAMHNALSFQRVHKPKGYTSATYHPDTNMAYTQNPKGPHFAKLGHVKSALEDPLGDDKFRGQRMWLLPEEVLYLLEIGNLDVRWPASDADEDGIGLPMSLQAAYAMFIGDEESHAGSLTFERFTVYSALKRMGYTVMRAPSWDSPGPPSGRECYPPTIDKPWHVGLLNLSSLREALFAKTTGFDSSLQREGPLVTPGLYRSYADIYRRLALVDYYDPRTPATPDDAEDPLTDPSFRITYHVWKPGSQTFKKSSPGAPDFRIAVVDARETAIPTLNQLSSLLETTPYDPPSSSAQLNQKLKHGYKNVILAIVDQGVASYLRIADAGFGNEKLYELKTRGGAGGKRGGRGGRGRGRGRGR